MIVALAVLAAIAPSHHHHRHCSPACVRRVRYHERRHARWLRDSMPVAVASWYDDTGATACGTHYPQGFASRTLPCGQRVRFCNGTTCATGVVQDRGPFIAGRLFDLNPGLKNALGCGDLCNVRYRLGKLCSEDPEREKRTVKILVNVPTEDFFSGLDSWAMVQGFKFKEAADGSFDLYLTGDYELARAQDREKAAEDAEA